MSTGPLSVFDTGNPDGPPAVFIHGFLSSNAQWDLNLERLGAVLRIILVELPGHGDSAAPDDPDQYAPAAVLAALDDIRARLEFDQWWVIGQSLGGAVGLRYTLAYPQRTMGVIFTNSRAAFGVESDDGGAQPPRSRRALTKEDLRRLSFHPVHAKRFPASVQERMVAAADAMEPHVVTHLGGHVDAWRSRDDLPQLSVPALLVSGSWESAFQPHVATARELIPDLRVVELEGGHSINVEQPEGFDQAVLDFVADRD